jgi:hypothetical protein
MSRMSKPIIRSGEDKIRAGRRQQGTSREHATQVKASVMRGPRADSKERQNRRWRRLCVHQRGSSLYNRRKLQCMKLWLLGKHGAQGTHVMWEGSIVRARGCTSSFTVVNVVTAMSHLGHCGCGPKSIAQQVQMQRWLHGRRITSGALGCAHLTREPEWPGQINDGVCRQMCRRWQRCRSRLGRRRRKRSRCRGRMGDGAERCVVRTVAGGRNRDRRRCR